jgi:hypothetical protein
VLVRFTHTGLRVRAGLSFGTTAARPLMADMDVKDARRRPGMELEVWRKEWCPVSLNGRGKVRIVWANSWTSKIERGHGRED